MKRQHGFGAIGALAILVVLAGFAAAIVAVGSSQQLTLAQDILSARAWQAARAGSEWGMYKALKGQDWGAASTLCDTGNRSSTLNLKADTGGFSVTVSCESWLYDEGETAPGTTRQVRIYRILAVACPAETCPASDATVAGPGYVERSRVATVQTVLP